MKQNKRDCGDLLGEWSKVLEGLIRVSRLGVLQKKLFRLLNRVSGSWGPREINTTNLSEEFSASVFHPSHTTLILTLATRTCVALLSFLLPSHLPSSQ